MDLTLAYRHLVLLASMNRFTRAVVTRAGFSRRFSQRFVPGEHLEDAIRAIRSLNAKGISATLDMLGESVSTREGAVRACESYIEILERIRETDLDTNISIKLTQMGLDVDPALARENMERILEAARGTFVRIDMESSEYTQRTLDMLHALRGRFENVGGVIQAYLYRSGSDLQRLIREGVRVRLCKGAYREDASIAFPRREDTDRNYIKLMKMLLTGGRYPAIATHDENIIREAIKFAESRAVPPDRFEFQMLYGIRTDLQEGLAGSGFNVRVYVPFGKEWYPYFTRRLAEHPANMRFFLLHAIRR